MTVDGWGNDRWLLPLLIVMMVSPKEYRVPVPPPPHPHPPHSSSALSRPDSLYLPLTSSIHCIFFPPPPLSPSPTLPYPSNPACPPLPPNFTSIAAFCRLHLSKHDVATFSTITKNKKTMSIRRRSFCRADVFQPFQGIIHPVATTNYLFFFFNSVPSWVRAAGRCLFWVSAAGNWSDPMFKTIPAFIRLERKWKKLNFCFQISIVTTIPLPSILCTNNRMLKRLLIKSNARLTS